MFWTYFFPTYFSWIWVVSSVSPPQTLKLCLRKTLFLSHPQSLRSSCWLPFKIPPGVSHLDMTDEFVLDSYKFCIENFLCVENSGKIFKKNICLKGTECHHGSRDVWNHNPLEKASKGRRVKDLVWLFYLKHQLIQWKEAECLRSWEESHRAGRVRDAQAVIEDVFQ